MDRPSVQRLLIAYAVDLICVLKGLFNLTIADSTPCLTLTTTWTEVEAVFKNYVQSPSHQRTHEIISITTRYEHILTVDDIRREVCELLQEFAFIFPSANAHASLPSSSTRHLDSASSTSTSSHTPVGYLNIG